MNVLAETLTKLCAERGLTMRAASMEALGEPETIRNIVRGKSRDPRASTLLRLSDYFGVDLARIVVESSEDKKCA
jgi:transcriptional regulator with XRE-family HTH domain